MLFQGKSLSAQLLDDGIVEFKFEPQVVKTGSKITLATSVLVAILIILGLFYQIKLNRNGSA